MQFSGEAALIIHEEAISRWAIRALLEQLLPGITVHEAADADDGMMVAKSRRMMLVMARPASDAETTAMTVSSIVKSVPGARVVVIGGPERADQAIAAARAGACAFVSQSVDVWQLRDILRLVLAGGHYFPLVDADTPAGEPAAAGTASPVARPIGATGLTPRQAEVARLIALGLANKEIARELNILEGTVKAHVRAVASVLGVRNRTQIALAAIQQGIIDVMPPSGNDRDDTSGRNGS